MAIINPFTIITLNVHELNSLIKRHRMEGWMKKQEPSITNLLRML